MSKVEATSDEVFSLCMSEMLSDITFIVGEEPDQKKFPAHRFPLSVSSPVFRKMFIGEWATDKREHELPDECPQAFEIVLKHIYRDKYELKDKLLAKTIYSAKKYELKDLEKECVKYMKTACRKENSFLFYEIAKFYSYVEIRTASLNSISCCFEQKTDLNVFQTLEKTLLIQLIGEQDLIVDELELFKQVHLWSEAECDRRGLEKSVENKRLVLEGILEKIRFPLMTPRVIKQEIVPTGLLKTDQLLELFQWWALNKETHVSFSIYPRTRYTFGTSLSLNAFDLSYLPKKSKKTDKIKSTSRI